MEDSAWLLKKSKVKAIFISWGQGHFIREKDLWLMVLPWLCSYKTGFLQTDLAAVPTGLPGWSFYHSVSCLIWVQKTLQITQVNSALRPRSKSHDLEEALSEIPTSSRMLGHSDEGTRTTATMDFACKPYTQKPALLCFLLQSFLFSKVLIHWEFREGGGRQNKFWSSLVRKKKLRADFSTRVGQSGWTASQLGDSYWMLQVLRPKEKELLSSPEWFSFSRQISKWNSYTNHIPCIVRKNLFSF